MMLSKGKAVRPIRSLNVSQKRGFSDGAGSTRVHERKPVGFIGLGNMGAPMAKNLIKAGFPLVVHDVNAESVSKLKHAGGDKVTVATSPREVVSKTTYVVTMLPSPSHVKEVYTASNGIFPQKVGDIEGKTLIDSSTIDVHTSKEISTLAEKHSAYFVDAPVSGGVQGATEATLTFMVGGALETYRRAEAVLQHMGKKVIHCGPNGNGLIAKLCNNMALGIEMIAISEAMNLGVSLGMDPKLLAQVINSSSGRCWTSEVYNPVPGVTPSSPANRDYQGGFAVSLMLKDLELALQTAEEPGTYFYHPIPTLLGNQARNVFRSLAYHGYGDKDFSSVYKYLTSITPKEETQEFKRSILDHSIYEERRLTPFRPFKVGVDAEGRPVAKLTLDQAEDVAKDIASRKSQ
jgi:3-hydroxyisobutyrate dehydrogenase